MNTMNRLPSIRILIVIGALLLILVGLFIVWILAKSPTEQPVIINDRPIPSSTSSITADDRPFEVIQSTPNNTLRIDEPVDFAFSLPVLVEDIVISIEPSTVIRLDLDTTGTLLRVTPENYWQPNTEYEIKILAKTLSINKKQLQQTQVVRFKTQPLSGM